MSISYKEQTVRRIVAEFGKVAVAFSGGVDSSLLLRLAIDTLGPEKVLALTVRSCLLPASDIERVASWAGRHGLAGRLNHEFIDINPLEWSDFVANPADRCYLCKSRVYPVLREHCRRLGIGNLLDGTHHDDLYSHRPGLKAIRELEINIPLALALLNKQEVRTLARKYGLDNWEAPSASCLATRIPDGLAITPELLARVEGLEAILLQMGFAGCRVRLDRLRTDTVFVHVRKQDLSRFSDEQQRENILELFRKFNVSKVYLDLVGR